MDPYARQVTSSIGNAVVYDPAAFDWGDHWFEMPARDDLVIYELHVGTFNAGPDRRGDFDRAARRLPYLRDLGVSAVQIMPPFEFAGDVSWGYNPAHLFAIESGYGGPDAFKRFIKAAHEHGIAVIVDVVYNHLGPSDLDLWQFDGWSANGGGGIYFYNDERAITPWGSTRPDYGRGEVRTFLRDSALTWLEEFQCDGLRFDATLFIRTVDGVPGDPASALPGRLVVHGLDQRRDPGAPAVEADDRRGHPGRHEARGAHGARAAPGSGPSGTSASSGGCGRPSRPATTGSGRSRMWSRPSPARVAARR